MARKIIILDVAKQPSGDFEVRAAYWLTAPANRIVPLTAAAKSAVPDATQAELDALTAGTVVEHVFASGLLTSGTTVASVKTALQNKLTTDQAALDATAASAAFIGLAFDGTTWA